MLEFFERVLRRDYWVRTCSNPLDALALLANTEFDLLITDHKMPELTGLELLERISQTHPQLVRVLVSGYTELVAVERAQERSQFDHYALKPIDSRGLLEAIETAVATRNRRRAGHS